MNHSNQKNNQEIKVNGVVAEYNPFHNGHGYQLQDAKAQTEADYTIIVMSGSFMQRGTPALLDKFKRAEMALRNGADLVIELPTLYSASSADYFATGAVTLLDKLGVVNFLCFGSERGDVDTLKQIADILEDEPEEFSALLKQYLKQGLSYPIARTNALMRFRPDLSDCRDILSSANNILGISYLKALRRRNSPIKPVTTKRTSSDYHDRMLGTHQSSALALRHAIYDGSNLQALSDQMPASAYEILSAAIADGQCLQVNDLSGPLHYKLLMEADEGYTSYLDVSEELSDRIRNHLCDFTSFHDFCELLKTKDMTFTRISRCLMHILLNIKTDEMEMLQQTDYINYARVLGFRKDAEGLLTAIKENACIPLLTKLADAEQVLDETSLAMLKRELRMNAVYRSAAAIRSGTPMVSEYRIPLVIV